MLEISPSHPNIQYIGRIDDTRKEALSFSHPGVNISLRFTGTRLHVLLDDNALSQTAQTTNYFNVIVDNAPPRLLKTLPTQKEYVLAQNLPSGTHTVTLFKRSESSHGDDLNVGKITITGFRIDKNEQLLPTTPPSVRMEFIGDSITCGYGNEHSSPNPVDDHFTTLNSNAYMAWGAIASRMLNAQYVAVAYSGRGMIRNFAGHASPTLPDVYLKIHPDEPDSPLWEPSRYTPDIVVVNLGTNDFSEGLTPGVAVNEVQKEYTVRYIKFIQELLGYYPKAHFILAIGPMLSNNYPNGYNALARVRDAIQETIRTLTSKGYNQIHSLELSPQQPPFGEDFHPTIATHQKMADELVSFIKKQGILPPTP